MVVVEGVEVPDEQAARLLIHQRDKIVRLEAQLAGEIAGRLAFEVAFVASFERQLKVPMRTSVVTVAPRRQPAQEHDLPF